MRYQELLQRLDRIGHTSKRGEKEALLQEIKDSPERSLFGSLVVACFDPYVTYGITAEAADLSHAPVPTGTDPFPALHKLMQSLRTRQLTGGRARAALREVMTLGGPSHGLWLQRFINCQWGIGLGLSTILKVFPELRDCIPFFEVQLCTEYKPSKHSFTPGYWVEPKLDGYRGLIGRFMARQPHLLSRQGKPLYNADRQVTLAQLVCPDLVLDGELFLTGQGFHETQSVCSTRDPHPERDHLQHWVFDTLDNSTFIKGGETPTLRVRRARTEEVVAELNKIWAHGRHADDEPEPFVLVPSCPAIDEEEAMLMAATYLDAGFEGIVFKDPESTYHYDRDQSWFKWKPFVEDEVVVIEIVEGFRDPVTNTIVEASEIPQGKTGLERVAARTVVRQKNGVLNGVGTGFKLEERRQLIANPEQYLNTVIEVKYQNLTPDGRMRFPRFRRFRPDKSAAEVL